MNKELLEKILKTNTPSGYEYSLGDASYFRHGLRDLVFGNHKAVDSYDKIGNQVVKIGNGPLKIMISAHYDEIAMQVLGITGEGLLNITNLGGTDRKVLPGLKVLVHTENGTILGVIGKRPIHTESPFDRDASEKWENILVDIGAETKEEAEGKVEIGDVITIISDPIMKFGENRVCGRALDDKAGIFTIMSVVEGLTLFPEIFDNITLYCVACTQEEVGLRGAKIVTKRIQPDISIDIDVTFSTDEGRGISVSEYGSCSLGKGPVIGVGFDKNQGLTKLIKNVAKEKNIDYQLGCGAGGGTNTSAIQLESFDCATGLLSFPIRNLHTPVEIMDYRDLEAGIKLLIGVILKISEPKKITA